VSARTTTTPAEELAAAAVVFGLFGLGACWWFPFGPAVGLVGAACGLGSWLAGGGRAALIGLALAGAAAGAGLLLAWDYWVRLTGLGGAGWWPS
jgi:hypothetical protein